MDMFHALAEPTRCSILEMLASKGQLWATEIGAQFPVSPRKPNRDEITSSNGEAHLRMHAGAPQALDCFHA